MVSTHTRTHVHVSFANPYLVCDQCGEFVPRWHNPAACGCDGTGWRNEPCGHQAEASSCCPSWGPVDGCLCQQMFGAVAHPSPAGEPR